jgi:hypothetical protein
MTTLRSLSATLTKISECQAAETTIQRAIVCTKYTDELFRNVVATVLTLPSRSAVLTDGLVWIEGVHDRSQEAY